MADQDSLALDNYSVELAGGFGLKLNFRDDKGNIVMKSQGKVMVTDQALETVGGKLLGTITHKMVSLGPTYELHEGGAKDKIVGSIKIPVQLMSTPGTLSEIQIRDAEDKVIATANGSFMDSEFSISDSSGKLIAKVTKKPIVQVNSALLQGLANLGSRNYNLSILEQGSIATIVLLELLVVIELLLRSGKGSSPGMVRGPAGFGGIKL